MNLLMKELRDNLPDINVLYQTLISSIIHKYITKQLIDETNIKKA